MTASDESVAPPAIHPDIVPQLATVRGKWVAVVDYEEVVQTRKSQRIVAVADSAVAAAQHAALGGNQDPIIFRVPTIEEPRP